MTTDLWQEKFLPFKEALVAVESRTADELAADVALLPSDERELLAQGPLTRRWDCRVCQVFDDLVKLLDGNQAAADLADPRWRVYLYHEVAKVRMTSSYQMHYGPLANEGYVRCVATYRAAGWDGHDPGPNA